jgi:hypothetical protein
MGAFCSHCRDSTGLSRFRLSAPGLGGSNAGLAHILIPRQQVFINIGIRYRLIDNVQTRILTIQGLLRRQSHAARAMPDSK